MRTRYKGKPIHYTNPANQPRWSQAGGVHTNPRAQDVLDDPTYPKPVGMVSKADRYPPAVHATKLHSWERGGLPFPKVED